MGWFGDDRSSEKMVDWVRWNTVTQPNTYFLDLAIFMISSFLIHDPKFAHK